MKNEALLQDMPSSWEQCFNNECDKCNECLHYATAQQLPNDQTRGYAIYPSAYRNGKCKYFKKVETVRMAYGFNHFLNEVKKKDVKVLREHLFRYFGGRTPYYRYNRGEYLLSPKQQQYILGLFAKYGYTDGLQFTAYKDVVSFM